MIERCHNPKATKYAAYGGRGIHVCERWKSFVLFYADMGSPPTADHQLDRIDNNGDYSPQNCRWATRIQQARNRRNNHLLEFNGLRLTISEWSERTGISYENIKNRVNNLGWSPARALCTP